MIDKSFSPTVPKNDFLVVGNASGSVLCSKGNDKADPAQRTGRNAIDSRVLREASSHTSNYAKVAGCRIVNRPRGSAAKHLQFEAFIMNLKGRINSRWAAANRPAFFLHVILRATGRNQFIRLLVVGIILVFSQSVYAEFRDSVDCPGALEEVNIDATTGEVTSVISRVIPAGGAATCIASPEKPLGVQPHIRSLGSASLTIAAGVDVPSFLLTGDGSTVVNSGTASGDLVGNNVEITNDGPAGSFLVTGDDAFVLNTGTAAVQIDGNNAEFGNGGTLAVHIEGSGTRLLNDPDATLSGNIIGDGSVVTNNGDVPFMTLEGSGVRVANNGISGIAGDMAIGFLVIGPDGQVNNAGTVETSGTEAVSIGIIDGDDARVDNTGTVKTTGTEAIAVGVESNSATVVNDGTLQAEGTESLAVFIEGDAAAITNNNTISATGSMAGAASVEGNNATITNNGVVNANGNLAAGLSVDGDMATIVNNGAVNTTGGAFIGIGATGNQADVSNNGTVTTGGADALGIGAIGQAAEVENVAAGTITTTGEAAHGMILGIEDLGERLPGAPLPPEALAPSQGDLVNQGSVDTSGAGADAMHVFANDSLASNEGTLETVGQFAHGISAIGTANELINANTIKTAGTGSVGILLDGDSGVLANDGSIETTGTDAIAMAAFGNSIGASQTMTNGNVDVPNDSEGNISTTGARAHGMALGLQEPIPDLPAGANFPLGATLTAEGNIANAGQISTTGEGADGIHARADISGFENLRTIETAGDNASGIDVSGNINDFTNTGTITTGGDDAHGIRSIGNEALVVNGDREAPGETTGSIKTTGTGSHGINVEENLDDAPDDLERRTFINAGTIRTEGDNSDGIHATVNFGAIQNRELIETTGENANGINVIGNNNVVQNVNSIMTEGMNSAGIEASGQDITITNGAESSMEKDAKITTAGDMAHGIFVSGLPDDPAAPSQADIKNFASIDTSGEGAHGIAAFIADGSVENQHQITVTGKDAYGISALGNDNTIVNAQQITAGETPDAGMGDPPADTPTGAGGINFSGNATVTNLADATINAFMDDGRGISAGAETPAAGATVLNQGQITVTGDRSLAISVIGDELIAPQRNTIVNEGEIRAGLDGPLEPDAPNGEMGPTFAPSENAVGIHIGGVATVTNAADAKITVVSKDGIGIGGGQEVAANNSIVRNLGVIQVTGSGGSGIDLSGDKLRVENGELDRPSSLPDGARIVVSGSAGAGIRTTGTGVAVHNSSVIDVDGQGSTAIEVNVQGPGGLWVDSDAEISVKGQNGIGIHVRSDTPGGVQVSSQFSINSDPVCVGGGLGGPGRILNCGGIKLNTAEIASAMLVEGIAETFIENQKGISGTGRQQRGIVVNPATNANPADLQIQNNIIENLGGITLSGESAAGAVLNATGNFFLNGTGQIAFELAPDGGPDVILSTFIDRMSFRGDSVGGVSEQQIGAQGIIRVNGLNGRGLVVNGNSNFIANMLSDVSAGVVTPPMPGEEPPPDNAGVFLGEIIASGLGGIAVEIQGSGNVIENQGLIRGQLFGVLGGDGSDAVINRGSIQGATALALGGGNDYLVFEPGAEFIGLVDGGADQDILRVAEVAPAGDQFVGSMDGNQFQNFENFFVDGALIQLFNTLDVETATVMSEGFLILSDSTLNANDITIEANGGLAGNGTVAVTPDGDGNISGMIHLLDGGLISAGNSPGQLDFLGDFDFQGLIEVEIGGLDVGLFDQYFVDGDVFIDGGEFLFSFEDDFLPELGDFWNFFSVTGDIFGMDTLSFDFVGLPFAFDFDLSLNALDGGGFQYGFQTTAVANDDPVSVAEPGTFALFLLGLAALGVARRREMGRT